MDSGNGEEDDDCDQDAVAGSWSGAVARATTGWQYN
jgi:hypothetical protein